MYELREQEEYPYDFLDDVCAYDSDYLGHCVSTNDCTGLIPAGMVTEAELLAYKDVYAFPTPMAVAAKDIYELEGKISGQNVN